MSTEEEDEIEEKREEIQLTNQQKITTDKPEKSEEIDTSIQMNREGILFFLLFISLLGYLIAAAAAGLPPFEIEVITGTLEIASDLLLTILSIVLLLFLGLGIYFGWIRKKPEEETAIDAKNKEDDEGIIVVTIEEGKSEDTELDDDDGITKSDWRVEENK